MSKVKLNKKSINTKRIQEIENYVYSLAHLTNPNLREVTKLNPISVKVNLEELRKVSLEVKSMEINRDEINLEAIYENTGGLSEVDKFIMGIGRGMYYMINYDLYSKMLGAEELDKVFNIKERVKRIKELEQQIDKDRRFIETFKNNKPLCKGREEKILESQKEIDEINKTLCIPTREQIIDKLYFKAEERLFLLSESIDEKIKFLEGVSN